jgi:hypothetical protein
MRGLALMDLTPAPRSRRAVEGAAGNPSGLSGHRRRLARLALEFATRRPLSARDIQHRFGVTKATSARDLAVIRREARGLGLRVDQLERGVYQVRGGAA